MLCGSRSNVTFFKLVDFLQIEDAPTKTPPFRPFTPLTSGMMPRKPSPIPASSRNRRSRRRDLCFPAASWEGLLVFKWSIKNKNQVWELWVFGIFSPNVSDIFGPGDSMFYHPGCRSSHSTLSLRCPRFGLVVFVATTRNWLVSSHAQAWLKHVTCSKSNTSSWSLNMKRFTKRAMYFLSNG